MAQSPSAPASTAPPSAAARRRRGPLVLLALFLLTLPAVTVRLYASDEVQYFAFLRSLWFDHDVSFENEYSAFYDRGVGRYALFRETLLERQTETGLRLNFGTIGPAILWLPFYAAADAGVVIARANGSLIVRDGYSWPYLAAVCYGSALYGFLAVLLSARLAERLTGVGHGAAAAIWLGTPLLFYMYLAPGMAHAVSAFSVAAMLTIWLHVRDRWTVRGTIALGAVAGLVVMVREQDAILLLAPLLDYAVALSRRIRRGGMHWGTEIALAAGGLVSFAVVYLPQAFAYLALNGRIGPSRLVTRKMAWTSPHALEVVFSPHHGLLAWTPLAALAIVGLYLLARRSGAAGAAADQRDHLRPVTIGLLLAVLGQIYISGAVESWTVAGAFGQRRFVAITPILTIGLAALWQAVRARPLRLPVGAVVAVAIWWNLGLMALFGTRMMDRQRLELGRNAYDVFITVPRSAPSLAWRYVVARDSFFAPPTDPR
jgi:hypothetical protein